MANKTKKERIIFMTVVSAVLYCALLVATSLSPLADLGSHANKFGTLGMWSALGMILTSYILPLAIYMAGINTMRFVMAFFCGLGILMNVVTLFIATMLGVGENIIPVLLSAAGICVDVMWFSVAFGSKEKDVLHNV